MARAEPGDRFSPRDLAARDGGKVVLELIALTSTRKMNHRKKMGIISVLFLFLIFRSSAASEEFAINITESIVTTEQPITTLEQNQNAVTLETPISNETISTPAAYVMEESTNQNIERSNITSGARRGRLVNGNWDTRELALQFQGSPAFSSGGFMPILPLAETIVSTPTEATPPVTEPATEPPTQSPLVNRGDESSDTLEDRILGPFAQSMGNIFIKDAVRKGPDSLSDFSKPSLNLLSGIPFQQQTQSPNQDNKPQFDPSQLAMAQAAIQAAQSLFSQANSPQHAEPSSPMAASSHPPPSISEPSNPWGLPMHHESTETFGSGSDPPPFLSVPPPSIPQSTIFRDVSDPGNKRYGGGSEPFHKYHDLTHHYYGGYPPQPPPMHYPPHPPPPPYHHHHGDGGKGLFGLGSVVHVFNDFKHNVVGTAHKFGEKIASIASPAKLSHLVPVATTLLVGGLALKLLTQSKGDAYNNTLPLISLGGKRKKRSLSDEEIVSKMLVFEKVPSPHDGIPVFYKEMLNTKRRKRNAPSLGKRLVFALDDTRIANPTRHVREKRSTSQKYLVFDFTGNAKDKTPTNPRNRKKRSTTSSRTAENKVATAKSNDTIDRASERSIDGTFTEEELNSLVNRLDPVQRQFLQKLQWYGFDKWKEMPCAKFILCDVIVHSDFQHIYDLQRRIGLFLSLMDDESARKVEVMIKDLILSIEARDCSQFYCQTETSQVYRPPSMSTVPHVYQGSYQPTWGSQLSHHYRHPYSYPRSSDSEPEITHERI